MLKTPKPFNNLKLLNNNFKNINTYRSFSYINQSNTSFRLNQYNQVFKRNNSTDADKVIKETVDKSVEFTSTLPDFNSQAENIASLTDQSFGYLKSLGMVEHPFYWLPDTIQQILELEHVFLGMQWGTAIVVTTLLGKMLLLPMMMKQKDVALKQAQFQKEAEPYNQKLYDGDLQNFQNVSVKLNQLKLQHGVDNQMKYLILPTVANSAFAISMFSGIRQMCNYPAMGMDVGGWLWFTDLSAVDPYLGLQFLSSISIYLYTKYGMMQDMQATNPGQTGMLSSPLMLKFLRVLPFLTIPLTMNLPSGVVLFISVSALTSVASSKLLKHTATRKLFGFKPFPTKEELEKMKPAAKTGQAEGFSGMVRKFTDAQKKQKEFMQKYYR
ncbi:uncharacterized protein HGUI_00344 [Hanseniaspora guilliermondii]|uniref:Membrane insertase YidC/Oxa/ALB C-terminal domain-containing protein n=1 Tax=Hanseniaspora guilliermondii TaxID=56406 RepID=A0A1L0AVK4_9ASCO|nr:uncharacterized protein HGUI_00344 [Hanseniaspora guilliermondii]